jgi:RHS repeat-associated protein
VRRQSAAATALCATTKPHDPPALPCALRSPPLGLRGYRYLTSTAPDGSTTLSTYLYGQLTTVIRKDAAGNPLGQTTYAYDPHGRQYTVTDARTGTITQYYNVADQVTNTVMPTVNGVAQSTFYYPDSMGRVFATFLPDSTWVTNKYNAKGELQQTYGSRTYPVGYGYDAQGRMTKMTNWTSAASGAGTRVTTWNYDQYRGFLASKVYDGSVNGPAYTYTDAGRLLTRLWARGTNTTYSHNNAGELAGVTYEDGNTPASAYGYDRRGRQTTITTGGTIACTLAYNDASQLLSETYVGGPLDNITITNGYDRLLRRTNNVTLSGGTVIAMTTNNFDAASRLQTISDGTNSATYSYLANSPLVQNITFQQNGTTRMVTTKTYDNLNRLTAIGSTNGAVALDSHAYAYDPYANQRTAVTNTDGSRWAYGYDTLGQVNSGKKYWSDATPVAGEQFGYTFDDIGNRTATQAGGDASGLNLRSASYSANTLNQYTSRTVPAAVDILGDATNTATVTVNNQPTYRNGTFYRAQVTFTNSVSSVYPSVTNLAVLNRGTNADLIATTTGNVFLPKTPEQFTYDPDGNLTSDGRWTNHWDAENRLISMESLTNTPAASKLRLTFAYDYKGRRITKAVESLSGSTWTMVLSNKFLYDGWNLVAELNGTNNAAIRSYMWGTDLSGSMQGAGGVGGLLAISSPGSAQFTCFDGNDNLTALIDSTSSALTGQYEYGPFGEAVRATGPMAKNNPFRFSAKYQDEEADLLYYGYRYYNASLGNWFSRDPIEELGHDLLASSAALSSDVIPAVAEFGIGAGEPTLNLYNFIGNSPIAKIDLLGRFCVNACGLAKAMGLAGPDAGGVICCGGNKYVCVWNRGGGTGAPGAQAQEIISKCIGTHESLHLDSVMDCPKCSMWPTRPPFKIPFDSNHDECEAHRAHVACLQSGLKECRGDRNCYLQVIREINYVTREMNAYCNQVKR